MSIVKFEPDDLRNLSSFDDALKMLAEAGIEVRDASTEIGDGFRLVEKDSLIETPMLLISWVFTKGDYGADFVTVRAMTKDKGKVIFNDGGLGICSQLQEYSGRTQATAGLLLEGGLRKSEYDYTDDKGNTIPATTYYLGV